MSCETALIDPSAKFQGDDIEALQNMLQVLTLRREIYGESDVGVPTLARQLVIQMNTIAMTALREGSFLLLCS